MALRLLENEINWILYDIDKLDFVELIRNCRLAIGLQQFRAAEHIRATANRLKNLENGNFHDMPKEYELLGLSRLYDIKLSVLEDKAIEYVKKKNKDKPIRKKTFSGYLHSMRENA